MIILFFKAQARGAQGRVGDLFEQKVPVKAHTTKTGVFVPEHQATRKKKAEVAQSTKPSHTPVKQSANGSRRMRYAQDGVELRRDLEARGIKEPMYEGYQTTVRAGGPHLRRTRLGDDTFELRIEAAGNGYGWSFERVVDAEQASNAEISKTDESEQKSSAPSGVQYDSNMSPKEFRDGDLRGNYFDGGRKYYFRARKNDGGVEIFQVLRQFAEVSAGYGTARQTHYRQVPNGSPQYKRVAAKIAEEIVGAKPAKKAGDSISLNRVAPGYYTGKAATTFDGIKHEVDAEVTRLEDGSSWYFDISCESIHVRNLGGDDYYPTKAAAVRALNESLATGYRRHRGIGWASDGAGAK